jgi:membrane protease subunit HflC
MKNAVTSILVILCVLIALIAAFGGFYNVNETDQVIITQFKKPIGQPITDPGLHFKIPFIQEVNRIEKRALAWDGQSVDMPTKDKTYVLVDTFGRWRISDPMIYFVRMGDERRALSRINDILGSATRTAIARHELIEIVRTDKDRKPAQDEVLADAGESSAKVGVLLPINYGRERIAQEIKTEAAKQLKEVGIELLDVRLKRVNYKVNVLQQIYQRMTNERLQIAQRFRSEGEGAAARIVGRKERELNEIESTAYKSVQQLKGEADAKASEIYARAYNQSPQAAEFFQFVKTLDTYRTTVQPDTSLVLTTDSDFFRLLKGMRPLSAPANAPSPPASTPDAPPPAETTSEE